MAGRFVLQKISSGTSRWMGLVLATHVSASARAAAPVVPRSSAARFLNTVASSLADAKTGGWSTTGMSSAIINHGKLASVNSVGTKQTFSSSASNWKARYAAWVAKTRA